MTELQAQAERLAAEAFCSTTVVHSLGEDFPCEDHWKRGSQVARAACEPYVKHIEELEAAAVRWAKQVDELEAERDRLKEIVVMAAEYEGAADAHLRTLGQLAALALNNPDTK